MLPTYVEARVTSSRAQSVGDTLPEGTVHKNVSILLHRTGLHWRRMGLLFIRTKQKATQR